MQLQICNRVYLQNLEVCMIFANFTSSHECTSTMQVSSGAVAQDLTPRSPKIILKSTRFGFFGFALDLSYRGEISSDLYSVISKNKINIL